MKGQGKSKYDSFIGMRFGRLLVVEKDIYNTSKTVKYVCVCDCGNKKSIGISNVVTGHTKSCGCLSKETTRSLLTKHGKCNSRTCNSWCRMKDRCYNKNNNRFPLYGGRGIEICSQWRDSFKNFLEDMGEVPEGMSLERIDVNGDYTPENCKWASAKEQSRNTRTNVRVFIGGRRACVQEVADFFEVDRRSILRRIKNHGEATLGEYLRKKIGASFEEKMNLWELKAA